MNIEDLISQYIDGTLSAEMESELHHRLAVSPEARQLFRAHIMLRGIARDQRVLSSPTQQLRAQLFDRLEREEGMRPLSESAGAPSAGVAAGTPIAGLADRQPIRLQEPARRRSRRFLPWLIPIAIAGAMFVMLWPQDAEHRITPSYAVKDAQWKRPGSAPVSAPEAFSAAGSGSTTSPATASVPTAAEHTAQPTDLALAQSSEPANGTHRDVPANHSGLVASGKSGAGSFNAGRSSGRTEYRSRMDDDERTIAMADRQPPALAEAPPFNERGSRDKESPSKPLRVAEEANDFGYVRRPSMTQTRGQEEQPLARNLNTGRFDQLKYENNVGGLRALDTNRLYKDGNSALDEKFSSREQSAARSMADSTRLLAFSTEGGGAVQHQKNIADDGTSSDGSGGDGKNRDMRAMDNTAQQPAHVKRAAPVTRTSREDAPAQTSVAVNSLANNDHVIMASGDVHTDTIMANRRTDELKSPDNTVAEEKGILAAADIQSGPQSIAPSAPPPPPPPPAGEADRNTTRQPLDVAKKLASSTAAEPTTDADGDAHQKLASKTEVARMWDTAVVTHQGTERFGNSGGFSRPEYDSREAASTEAGSEEVVWLVSAQQNSLVNVTTSEFSVQAILRLVAEFANGRQQVYVVIGASSFHERSSDSLAAVWNGSVVAAPAAPVVTTTVTSKFNEYVAGAGYRFNLVNDRSWTAGIGGWVATSTRALHTGAEIPIAFKITRVFRIEIVPSAQFTRAYTGAPATSVSEIDTSKPYSERHVRSTVPEHESEVNLGIGIGASVSF